MEEANSPKAVIGIWSGCISRPAEGNVALPAFSLLCPFFRLQDSFHADGNQLAGDFEKRAKNSSTNFYGSLKDSQIIERPRPPTQPKYAFDCS
jgi:hypothetical protein